jgi:hypothetical protein
MRAVLGLVWHTATGFVQITDITVGSALQRPQTLRKLFPPPTVIQLYSGLSSHLPSSPFMTLPTSDGRPIPRIAIVSFLFSVLRTQYRIIAVVQTHG